MKKAHSADIQISAAAEHELSEVFALLDECGLPREGLMDHLATTLVARIGEEIVGCSALELYGKYALLRSVAVKPPQQGRGAGTRLTKAALDLASRHQVATVYLLTETASEFFSKLGFKPIPRSEVSKEVLRSIEFTTLCPDTATVMTIPLKQGP